MHGIYKLYKNEELLYVGKTNNFYKRFNQHKRRWNWAEETTHIETTECKSKDEMDMYEKYYIEKLSPKHNKVYYNDAPKTGMQELNFTRITLDDFIRENTPSTIAYYKAINKKQKPKLATITLEFNDETYEKFKNKTKAENISMAEFVRNLIKKFIEENK